MSDDKNKNFTLGTFNVRGLTKSYKQRSLSEDINRYNIDICCLQETKIKENKDILLENGNRLITLGTETGNIHYGNGFIINKKWRESVNSFWKVSDRICILQLKTAKSQNKDPKNPTYQTTLQGTKNEIKMKITKLNPIDHVITIINVYAPTSDIAKTNKQELEKFYSQLTKITNDLKQSTSIIFTAGDFNSKVGKSEGYETCLGKWSRGTRNENGEKLIDFCESSNKFICNTAFQHQAKHITTWQCQTKNKKTNKIVNVYNQIDYIIMDKNQIHTLSDSRSYSGAETSSDHRIVVARMEVNWSKLYSKSNPTKTEKRIDTNKLVYDKDIQEKYQQESERKINELINNNNSDMNNVKNVLKEVAIEQLGYVDQKPKRFTDTNIEKLSKQQKQLRLEIENNKDPEKHDELRNKRKQLMKDIQKRIKCLQEKEVDDILKEVGETNEDAQMFKAVKKLNKQNPEIPSIFNESGQSVTNKQEMYKIIEKHFKEHFHKENIPEIQRHIGVPKPLTKKIDTTEIKSVVNKMSNNKAALNNTPIELIKYGPSIVHEQIAENINEMFENHRDLELGKGELVPLPKPNKAKGPVNHLRPITLLDIIRKILSKIEVNRTENVLNRYLSKSQCAYRKGKSTTEIIWAYKWIIAKIQEQEIEVHVVGIDMSSAFDTIHRHKILEIAQDIMEEDELRILRALLSETSLKVRVKGAQATPFPSNISSPQDDSVSGPLFTIYFEHYLKKLRQELDNEPINVNDINPKWIEQRNSCLPNEMAYADDCDLLTENEKTKTIIEKKATTILKEGNLHVNQTKTEHTLLKRKKNTKDEIWRNVKKLGSLLGDREDIKRRKQLSCIAFNNSKKLWLKRKYITIKRKLKLYDSLVKSILLYNCSTWGLTVQDMRNLNSFHRRQLRKVINIRWPQTINNKKLYEKTNTKPISVDITKRRWTLLGHILRMDKNTPGRLAMKYFFEKRTNRKFRGRKRTTIVTTINRDIKKTRDKYNDFNVEELNSEIRLHNIGAKARNRKLWKVIVDKVVEVAYSEAS